MSEKCLKHDIMDCIDCGCCVFTCPAHRRLLDSMRPGKAKVGAILREKIIIVGIGPGSSEYMIPAALKTIEEAKVLVGGSRAMEQYGKYKGQNSASFGRICMLLWTSLKGSFIPRTWW